MGRVSVVVAGVLAVSATLERAAVETDAGAGVAVRAAVDTGAAGERVWAGGASLGGAAVGAAGCAGAVP